MFGKWIEIIQRVRDEAQDQQSSQPNKPPQQQDREQSVPSEDKNIEENQTVTMVNEQAVEEKPPTEEDFEIPTTKEAYESMIDRFKTVGISQPEADEAIKARALSYNRACREFKKKQTEKKKQIGGKGLSQTRRSSLINNK